MKKRNIMVFSVIALAIILVAGGTMAWFTAESNEITNTFTAGNVKIELNELVGKYTYDDGEYIYPTVFSDPVDGTVEFDIVNPGDKFVKEIEVENTGSKAAFVRVKLDPSWDPDTLANIQIITFATEEDLEANDNDGEWVFYEGDYYYNEVVLAGETTKKLLVTIDFPGAAMDDDYQEATFTLEVVADAIQSSNGAAAAHDEWGIDPTTLPLAQ